jgi:hypothetical protein
LLIVATGAVGDILHHALPADLARDLAFLLGADGGRAHLVTFAGMLLVVFGLSVRPRQRRQLADVQPQTTRPATPAGHDTRG